MQLKLPSSDAYVFA
jgi:hypothetical protein